MTALGSELAASPALWPSEPPPPVCRSSPPRAPAASAPALPRVRARSRPARGSDRSHAGTSGSKRAWDGPGLEAARDGGTATSAGAINEGCQRSELAIGLGVGDKQQALRWIHHYSKRPAAPGLSAANLKDEARDLFCSPIEPAPLLNVEDRPPPTHNRSPGDRRLCASLALSSAVEAA
jgi:hypothetical protein